MQRNKRFALIAASGIAIAAYFWISSRYPDLNAKAVMAQSGTVADTIAARPIIEVHRDLSFARKVAYTTVNWCWDNRKGMTFGVLLAAILLTLAGYLPPMRRKGRFLNSLYGFFIGSPLGVCVNCAAPIFKGVLQSQRIETAFAAMLSSPTMNFVVLTMVFTLFPPYMGILKIIFSLAMIFIGVPLIARILGPNHPIKDLTKATASARFLTPTIPTLPDNLPPEGWVKALAGAFRDLASNLWFMTSRTVPLMLVAGFLGSLLSHAIPVDFLASRAGVAAVIAAAVVGTILPVPMAFDVLLSNALYTHGAPIAIVMTLLCTLGIFSIYSFMITWQSTSRTWAFSLIGLIIVTGSGVGLVAPWLHDTLYVDPNAGVFQREFAAKSMVEESAIDRLSITNPPPFSKAPPVTFEAAPSPANLHISRAPFRKPTTRGPALFTKLEGQEIGLGRGFRYGIRDYPDPFWIGRGTASGDYNRDGWPDLAFGTDIGPVLYENNGGSFEERRFPGAEKFAQTKVYAVAFPDLNNDGWPDFFMTTYGEGNFVVLSHDGHFDFDDAKKIPNNGAILTVSPAFGDFDHDGFVDIVNGNMALGIITGFHSYDRRRVSSIVYNRNLAFTEKSLGQDAGETMSSLVSDLRGTGLSDIILGHDFVFPDEVFVNDGAGDMGAPQSPLLPVSPVFTMGIDSGDLNNDLRLDLVMMGTIERAHNTGKSMIDGRDSKEYSKPKWGVDTCNVIADPIVAKNCKINRESDHLAPFNQQRNLALAECTKLANLTSRQDCLLSAMWLLITNEERVWDCDKDFNGDARLRGVCQYLKGKGVRRGTSDFPRAIPQRDANFVYLADSTGNFRDINASANATGSETKPYDHPGGWTWGVRIADLDNDGWQDIFNSEGAVRVHDYGFNVFMKNINSQKFEQRQFSANLTNDFGLFSFTMFDLDQDGDLDIVGNSSIGPVQVYVNQTNGRQSAIEIDVSDTSGQQLAIGAKVIIDYNHGKNHQIREVKASGGYLSFDVPTLHFGLGDAKEVDGARIWWPDGSQTQISQTLAAGYRYRIERVSK